ncbi:enoyl-CoA hydratase [Frigidibacter albus]|uniref:Enoyl-CoA hydratase n=1 Tax=Frigidibacter albus TaxID=1465486 RepID=A0A6L8VL73_9RHOB|nr:enoyl-CoA hydratase [Frigidibacter albus]MZQ91108.1 enoyl-CoA hydratase [Frigidibacter albus]NBE32993.1 enoyl-CoA hydratase [Frigidibacter albus]GGH62819.1 enoyl-CoA hydratase [Frigidibacter albus]
MSDVLLTELVDGVMTITLNRPEVRNALNQPLFLRLTRAIEDAGDDPDVRCVVIAGAGVAFCGGGDLNSKGVADPDFPINAKQSREEGWPTAEMRSDRLSRYGQAFYRLHVMGKPTIARLQGSVVGAGLSLALACDFRIAAEDTKIITGFVDVGYSGDCGISYYLPLIVGPARARELLLLSPKLTAAEAAAMQLVTRAVPAAELDAEVGALARRLAGGPTIAYRYIKRNLALAEQANFHEVLEAETITQRMAANSEDHKEAVTAFREKRKPVFQGR